MLEPSQLPTEILHQIIAAFPNGCFASCALVSKAWNTIFTPALYSDIELVWQRPQFICNVNTGFGSHPIPCPCEGIGRCNPDSHAMPYFHTNGSCLALLPADDINFPSLYRLTRTALTSPSLLGMTRSLRLLGPVPQSIWTSPWQTELTQNDRSRIRKLIQSTRLPLEGFLNAWLDRLDSGLPGAYVALLLLCLRGLQHVEIGVDFHDPLRFISPHIATLLPRLETASIGASMNQPIVYMGGGRAPHTVGDIASQLSLFYLPTLRFLSLNLPIPNELFKWINEVPLAMSLSSLELPFTHMGTNDLLRLLMACPNVRNVKYDLWTVASTRATESQQDPFDTSAQLLVDILALRRALLGIASKLEVFHFHVSAPSIDWVNQCLGHLPFNEFSCLTTLHVPFQVLLGYGRTAKLGDSLPSSLVNLWLNDDAMPLWLNHDRFINAHDYHDERVYDPTFHPIRTDQEIITIITEFLFVWRMVTPNLRSIRLLFSDYRQMCWRRRDVAYISGCTESLAMETGLRLSVYNLPWRSRYPKARSSAGGQVAPYFDIGHIEKMRLPQQESNP